MSVTKYKKLNMAEHKTDMNITEYKKLNMNITKYKKLNMTKYKTDRNITKIDKYKKPEQQFYDGAQNIYEHY